MEPDIKNRFDYRILAENLARFDVDSGKIRLLDGFESFIYEYQRDGRAYILRIGHSLRRSEELIQAEVSWINHLFRGGVSVSRAVHSSRGRLVEAIDDGKGEYFLATVFVKAPGQPLGNSGWEDALVRSYGRLLGRMHALSRTYRSANPAWRRPEWDDPAMLDVEGWLPPSETDAFDRYHELMAYLRGLPKDAAGYGLIHYDAHAGNFFVDDQGRITLFDFDDCVYSWYVNDIAIVLFYAALFQADPAGFAGRFLRTFLQGYYLEHDLDPAWLSEIPHFLKLREIDLYAVIHRSFDLDDLDDEWVRGYLVGRKERIERDVPFLDLDFDGLAAEFRQPPH